MNKPSIEKLHGCQGKMYVGVAKTVASLTPSQRAALEWLNDHGGDGAFVRGGATIIAQGEVAPMERKTWLALRDAGAIVFYNPGGKGYGRVKVTA